MSFTEHSPGPWIFCGNHIDDSEGILLLRSTRVFERLNCFDLRLAATAPELLTALKSMVDMFERHIEGREGPDDAAVRWDNAREAIAKAEGGAK